MSEAPIPSSPQQPPPPPAPVGAPEPERATQLAIEEAMARLRDQQNMGLAVVGGIAAAVAGAVLWGLITAATERQYGIMAIGIGFLVGLAVRFLGKGVDTSFRVVAAVCSAAGCLIGNYFAICFVAKGQGVAFWDALGKPDVVFKIIGDNFGFMDVVFYAIAIYCGWQFALRQLDEGDLQRLAGGAPKGP
jgi:hypothetical protein